MYSISGNKFDLTYRICPNNHRKGHFWKKIQNESQPNDKLNVSNKELKKKLTKPAFSIIDNDDVDYDVEIM